MSEVDALYQALFPVPQFVVKPPGNRVLVLAPHPDDEVIGCGGTLCKHVQAGDSVMVAYITDGALGSRDSESSAELARLRLAEAGEGLAVLGVQDRCSLGLADRNFQVDGQSCAAMAALLERADPDLIYVPHPNDRHRDHWAVNLLLAQVLPRPAHHSLLIAGYEVWSALQPTHLVNISDQFAAKQKAILAHKSQAAFFDYPALLDALGRYRVTLHHPNDDSRRIALQERRNLRSSGRSYTLPWTHLEAFQVLPAPRYLSEIERMVGHGTLYHHGD